MKDTQLYSQILGIEKPWKVTDVQVSLADDEVKVSVEHGGAKLRCPRCGKACSGYDKRQRRLRHLDTCQFKTLLVADVPGCSVQSTAWLQYEFPGRSLAADLQHYLRRWLLMALLRGDSPRDHRVNPDQMVLV